ncbi:phosphatase PAP2 family protein [Methylorubrum salsuginis]|uniref:PAP2 superfamily protein n=1 Tax=Methylorubrum salsuginis TaxID=414703 RepID=A0A1I4FSW4_9HYPH|nr:phosphatase PAP2 family protein [Methylorubrum salsuginis]SFL19886.1 PAP2 superfamily protein [Methylorubrum salsuginis]
MLLDVERAAGARCLPVEGKAEGNAQGIGSAREAESRRRPRLTAGLAAPGRGFWGIAAGIGALDLLGIAWTGLRVEPLGFLAALGAVLVLLAAAFLCSALREPKLRAMALASAYLIAVTTGLAVLHVLAAMPALPLADETLAGIETALGFDGPAYLAFLAAHPDLARVLALAYHSSGPQIGLVVVVLSAVGRTGRLWAYARLFTLALAACILVSAFVPAAGTYAAAAVQGRPTGELETVGALWHLDMLQALRDGRFHTLALFEIRGLVTFPSFHASLAVLTGWALRPVPVIGPLALLLNATIVVAAIGAGGHYLPDVMAGAALAFALVAARRR